MYEFQTHCSDALSVLPVLTDNALPSCIRDVCGKTGDDGSILSGEASCAEGLSSRALSGTYTTGRQNEFYQERRMVDCVTYRRANEIGDKGGASRRDEHRTKASCVCISGNALRVRGKICNKSRGTADSSDEL